MKFKLLTPFAAAAIILSGCQEQKKQDVKFSCQYPVTYTIDTIQSLTTEDIIKDGKIGTKVKGRGSALQHFRLRRLFEANNETDSPPNVGGVWQSIWR